MPRERQIDELAGAIRRWRHWVGNDMLDSLGVPKIEMKAGREETFRLRLQEAPEQVFRLLYEFFELGEFAPQPGIWGTPGLKLFVSHVAPVTQQLSELVAGLIANGIAPFLAHEAIKPTKDWRKTLLEALASMDALMSFHSEGFSESEWCGQEVGFALGRDVPVIAVMEAERPAGFLAATQAVRWRRESKEEALEAVYHTLCQAPTTAAALAYAAARKLKFVDSYDAADHYVERLQRFRPLQGQARRHVELASLLNDQVGARAEKLIQQAKYG